MVALLALFAALGGIAAANIPDSSGVIHACYPKGGGALSVIDNEAGQSCPNGSTDLTWNQTGPQGPAGAQGAAGPPGPQGAPGPQGPAASSAVYHRSVSNVDQASPGGSTLASLGLPHGNYTLSAVIDAILRPLPHSHEHGPGLRVEPGPPVGGAMTCRVLLGTRLVASVSNLESHAVNVVAFPFQTAFTNPAFNTLRFICVPVEGISLTVPQFDLIVTPVDAIG